MIAFEIEVVLLLSPNAVATGLMTTRIAGERALTKPLNPVDCLVEQESESQLGTEDIGSIGH
jgi:hypothetical protein